MSNNLLARAMVAGAAIAANRIVKFDAIDGQVLQAAAAADLSVGVVEGPTVGVASGERCDVVLSGVAEVTLGGTVARGALVTSDATGRAVTAASTNRAIGMAMVSGVIGDVVEVRIAPSVV